VNSGAHEGIAVHAPITVAVNIYHRLEQDSNYPIGIFKFFLLVFSFLSG
jgi:hypothetical protein